MPEEIRDRIPPQDLGAERSALSSMMMDYESAAIGVEELEDDHFFLQINKSVFNAICAVYNQDRSPDEISVCDQLRKTGILDRSGGPETIHSIASSAPSAANIDSYIKIIKEMALRRKMIIQATQVLKSAEDNMDASEILDSAEEDLFKLRSGQASQTINKLDAILDGQFEYITNRTKSGNRYTGLQVGFSCIDKMTYGLQGSEFIILAARPSVGKSALALNIIDYVTTRLKKSCLLFTLEMSHEQIGMRMLSSHCHIPHRHLMSGELTKAEWEILTDQGMTKLRPATLFVDDAPSITSLQIRSKARRLKATNDIGLVVVDYLQLVKSEDSKRDSREREVAKISALFKALARELRVPVLALSQLNRAADDRNGGKPGLASLRESGALEQDADVVMLMHRQKEENGSWNHNTTLEIAKQRNGPTGQLQLIFQPQFMSFIPRLDV